MLRRLAIILATGALAGSSAASASAPALISSVLEVGAGVAEASILATFGPDSHSPSYVGIFLAPAARSEASRKETCAVPNGTTDEELVQLVELNCHRVNLSVQQFEDFASKWNLSSWQARGEGAKTYCSQAMGVLDTDAKRAAQLALRAWGDELMSGHECCIGLRPPYCVSVGSSRLGHLLPFAAVVSLVLLAGLCMPLLSPSISAPALFFTPMFRGGEDPTTGVAAAAVADDAATLGAADPVQLQPEVPMVRAEELLTVLRGCSLCELPGAEDWVKTTAELFSRLQQVFGFQPDSARNQLEHLLSLWRSHCAISADSAQESGRGVDEKELLESGLVSLHGELLEGLCLFRERMRGSGAPDHAEPVPVLKLAGVMDSLSRLPVPRQRELAEVAVFLLIWGEAGNVRFMPELICFLTDLALHAECPTSGAFFVARGRGAHRGSRFKFLAEVIRPIYNTVFDENYESVTINAQGKDVRKGKQGNENFLPPDCANYDDWNELFCDPARLKSCMVLEDGTPFFNNPRPDRFAHLDRVNWRASLSARNTKTHREVHSFWGVFAPTHRIWLAHLLLFICGLCYVAAGDPAPFADESAELLQLLGNSRWVRWAAVGLLVPVHALFWKFSRWVTAGHHVRVASLNCLGLLGVAVTAAAWSLPVVTYGLIRYQEWKGVANPEPYLSIHLLISALGLGRLLFFPAYHRDTVGGWTLAKVPLPVRLGRTAFWLLIFATKLALGVQVISAVYKATKDLNIVRVGQEPVGDIWLFAFSPFWDEDVIIWLTMWSITFVLFLADTQMWFVLGCSVLGTLLAIRTRTRNASSFILGDAVASIPRLLAEKVLCFAGQQGAAVVYPVWDRVVEWMRYEDKIDDSGAGNLSFCSSSASISWQSLQQPLGRGGSSAAQVSLPLIFQDSSACERFLKRDLGAIPDEAEVWPKTADLQWRLLALSRGLALEMPRPFRAPYIPGITVLIPHYGETIIMTKEELFKDCVAESPVPLMEFLRSRYPLEFRLFTNRMLARGAAGGAQWPRAGDAWGAYGDSEWPKICRWASMRSQTLWRTVAGMTLYHSAIKCHFQVQRDETSRLARKTRTQEVFTCLVSMQMYAFFSDTQLEHTNAMLEKFPNSLHIAFIGHEDKGEQGNEDNVHPRQARRYFSCLINNTCRQEGKRRVPHLKIELPGFPVLGDGKGDNQNHAIIFTRGQFVQCVDANQGAYFEQMLLLPCVLGEFRRSPKKIVGLPEHITSDFGSIGDFAASAETAFGTVLQRTYAALGARMHYGHPDIMNKCYMMQQGGVSKATKTVNLSEDIFAGMDFTLRGSDRSIHHREYFHVAKGRDLGFNTVLMFFSKLSAGTGEQLLSRQVMRLGQLLPLPELFAFFYAHGGFYLTQHLVSRGPPLVMLMWLLLVLSQAEQDFSSMEPLTLVHKHGSVVMAELLSTTFSWPILLFLTASMMPLLMEIWMEYGLVATLWKFAKQMLTLAPLHFVFQAKIIGIYTTNELTYGGATYVNTGRGLPTERRRFIGRLVHKGGLYTDYAEFAFYDGTQLLLATVLVFAGGAAEEGWASIPRWWLFTLALTIASWLFTPFVFNPYQFVPSFYRQDWAAWREFFFDDCGNHWKEWYDKAQLKPASGMRASPSNLVISFLFIGIWYTVVNSKLHMLRAVTSASESGSSFSSRLMAASTILPLLPPVFLGIFAIIAWCAWTCCVRSRQQPRRVSIGLGAAVVVSLDCAEGLLSLWSFISMGWWKTFAAALILKGAMLSLLLHGAECLLRFRGLQRSLAVPALLERWLSAHRFATDVFVSLLILCTLAPFVLFDAVRSRLCSGCSLHQLLVYRVARSGNRADRVTVAPGQLMLLQSFDSVVRRESSLVSAVPSQPEEHRPSPERSSGGPTAGTTQVSGPNAVVDGAPHLAGATGPAAPQHDLEAELEAEAASVAWRPGTQPTGPPPNRPVAQRP